MAVVCWCWPCNAGGVIVSYFEWVQNREARIWTLDEISGRLHAIGVERVAEATRLRGLYP